LDPIHQGYTGHCPDTRDNEHDRGHYVSPHGSSSFEYVEHDVVISDTGFIELDFQDPPAWNGTNLTYVHGTNGTNGTHEHLVRNETIGNYFYNKRTYGLRIAQYLQRTSHEMYCEKNDHDLPRPSNTSNSTNGTTREMLPVAPPMFDVLQSNGTNVTNTTKPVGSVLHVVWKCKSCTLQRVGSLRIGIEGGSKDALLPGEYMPYAVSASAIQYDINSTSVVPDEDNRLSGFITPLDSSRVLRGYEDTNQRVTLMPALYSNDNKNIFDLQGYRVQYGQTLIGGTADKNGFISESMANELNFIASFEVGSYQFETTISPKMTALNALCELGGLFGAVAGLYIGMMLIFEKVLCITHLYYTHRQPLIYDCITCSFTHSGRSYSWLGRSN
jgi:hypothetical protein